MGQSIRNLMTSNPCTIDADKSVAYAAKMMRDEDVGLAPIVEGDKLVGMLTDRDIAVRVAAQGRDPEQVKVRDVASKKLVTIDPQQDLDEALRIMAKHQVRRLPVVEEDGRLVGVVAQADIARKGDEAKTGQLVEEISEPGGQMSSFEEGRFQSQFQQESPQEPEQEVERVEQPEEEGISRVAAASSRGRRRTRRATTTRARSTTRRKTTRRKSTAKKSTARKTTRKRAPSRKAAAKGGRKTAARKRTTRKAAAKGGRKTAARKRTTRRKTTRKKATARKTTRKRAATTRRKTTRKKATARKSTARKTTRKRTTRRAPSRKAAAKGGRTTARRRTTRRRTTRKK
jgi:CBS domain-containing protein